MDYPQRYAALSQQRQTQVEIGSVRPKAETGSRVECTTATPGRTSQLESERRVVGPKLKCVPTHLCGGSSCLVRTGEDSHGDGHCARHSKYLINDGCNLISNNVLSFPYLEHGSSSQGGVMIGRDV